MHVHLLVPDLLRRELLELRPYLNAEDAPAFPALEMLLCRGRRERVERLPDDWLADRFGMTANLPTAANSLLGDGGDPGASIWLRADPVQLTIDRDTLVLADASVFSLATDESNALRETINRHFAPDLSFTAPHPLRWYARLGREQAQAASLQWTPTWAVRGRSVNHYLPRGEGAMRWNALANEVQMLLHDHPVNVAREARGEPQINALWLWGAGTLARGNPRPFGTIWTDDPMLRGMALTAGVQVADLPDSCNAWIGKDAPAGTSLIRLDSLSPPAAYGDQAAWWQALARLEQDWFAPLLASLRSNRIGMLTLVIPAHRDADGALLSGVHCETTRGDLRRFWRRLRPLTQNLPRTCAERTTA